MSPAWSGVLMLWLLASAFGRGDVQLGHTLVGQSVALSCHAAVGAVITRGSVCLCADLLGG